MSQAVTLFNTTRQTAPSQHIPSDKPFLLAAMQYHSLGLSIIPCMGDSGKISCVKWAEYQDCLPTYRAITQWQKQFPAANIGLLTGPISNLTVVDIDTGKPEIIRKMIERFGDTPIKIKTPRGGMHLYYKFKNETCHTAIDGLPVDIRAAGGYVIAPPSINPQTKRTYSFVEGGLPKIQNLPHLKTGSLIVETLRKNEPDIQSGDIVYEGQRNNTLFKELLSRAKECSSFEELEDTGYFRNETFMFPPLPQDEVQGIINNVWRLKIENKLYGGGERFITVMGSEIQTLQDQPRAFWLLMCLKNAHENRRTSFAISPRAIAEKTGWDSATVREARNILLERKYLELVHRGGSKPGDVSIFRFYKGTGLPPQ